MVVCQNAVSWTPNAALPGVPLERQTLVTSPVGDDTVYYFRALPSATLNQTADTDLDYVYWDYSLPYTRRVSMQEPTTGKTDYLSAEYYKGSGPNPGTLPCGGCGYATTTTSSIRSS